MVQYIERINSRLKDNVFSECEVFQHGEAEVVISVRAQEILRESSIVITIGLIRCGAIEA
jgi:hypothetical protein